MSVGYLILSYVSSKFGKSITMIDLHWFFSHQRTIIGNNLFVGSVTSPMSRCIIGPNVVFLVFSQCLLHLGIALASKWRCSYLQKTILLVLNPTNKMP